MTIFNPDCIYLPAVIYDYKWLLNPREYQTDLFDLIIKDHMVFRTAIACSTKVSQFTYRTDLYPIYIIIKTYMSIYNLYMYNITFDGNEY